MDGEVSTHVDTSLENDSFVSHQIDAPEHHLFVQFKVGNPQSKQAADIFVPLHDGDPMARPVKLLGHRQTRRAGTHDSYFFSGPYQGRLRLDPTLIETPVGDLFFDIFNRHRIVVDV